MFVFFKDLTEVFTESVAAQDIRGCDAVEYHVHGGDDVWQGLFFLAEEGFLLQYLAVGCAFYLFLHVAESFA